MEYIWIGGRRSRDCLWWLSGHGMTWSVQLMKQFSEQNPHFRLFCAVVSRFWLFVIPWAAARKDPRSMGSLHTRMLEWVDTTFRAQGLNLGLCIAGGFFTDWATREAHFRLGARICFSNTNSLLQILGQTLSQSPVPLTSFCRVNVQPPELVRPLAPGCYGSCYESS